MIRSHRFRFFIIFLAVAAILGYAAFESRGLREGPSIVVAAPQNGATVHEKLTYIEGTAERISKITLNGREIFISETGDFKEPLALLEGYNEITLIGVDRFGEETEVVLELLYREEPSAVQTGTSTATTSPTE